MNYFLFHFSKSFYLLLPVTFLSYFKEDDGDNPDSPLSGYILKERLHHYWGRDSTDLPLVAQQQFATTVDFRCQKFDKTDEPRVIKELEEAIDNFEKVKEN